MRRLCSAFLYLIYLLCFVVATDYAFYIVHLRHLIRVNEHRIPRYSEEQLRRARISPALMSSIGWFNRRDTGKPSRYTHFSVAKPSGVIRIGAFGDSTTWGDEVSPDLDFPTLLGKLFREHGAPNVQVLNFGNSGHGFHQAFRIWREMGEKYHLDFVLLGPWCFQVDRDTTFGAMAVGTSPYFFHGIYVRTKSGPKFIDVLGGADPIERFREYYRFFPEPRYAHYDTEPPAFLASAIPAGLQLFNPFYYKSRKDVASTVFDVDVDLMKQIAGSGAAVILLSVQPDLLSAASRDSDLFALGRVETSHHFPYFHYGHPSGIGNLQIAKDYFAILTGQKSITRIQTRFVSQPPPGHEPLMPPLSEISRVQIRLGGRVAGELDETLRPGLQAYVDHPAKIAQSGTRSFFAFISNDTSPLDAIWIPLSFPIREGDALTANGRPIGSVHLLHRGSLLGYCADSPISSSHGLSRSDMRISIAGKLAFTMRFQNDTYEEIPLIGRSLRFKPLVDTILNLIPEKSGIPVTVSYVTQNQETSYPIGRLYLDETGTPVTTKGIHKLIRLDRRRGAVLVAKPIRRAVTLIRPSF